jgi:hypothetical protein
VSYKQIEIEVLVPRRVLEEKSAKEIEYQVLKDATYKLAEYILSHNLINVEKEYCIETQGERYCFNIKVQEL